MWCWSDALASTSARTRWWPACGSLVPEDRRGRRKDTRTFRSFVGGLEAMAEWFADEGVTEVAMEATGSYWRPVWYVLEDRGLDLKLVNAHHLKILPGRKSDILDAEWIAELLEHGLLRGSFVPPRVIRELRDLTR
jgi:transposase